MDPSHTRYLVLRVPTSGPKALAGPPNEFATLDEAKARVAAILSKQLKTHHTHLEIVAYSGDKAAFLAAHNILV